MNYIYNNMNLDKSFIISVIFVFMFLKFGLKELKLIYFVLISIGIVYYIRYYDLLNPKKNTGISSEIENALKKIEKYDKNNLFLKIKNNVKRFYNNKNSKDMGFLKDRILGYINSLNVSKDDTMIDKVYSQISSILSKKLK